MIEKMERHDEWELAVGLEAMDFKDPKTGEMRPYIVGGTLEEELERLPRELCSRECIELIYTSWSWTTRRDRQRWRHCSIRLSSPLSLGNNKTSTSQDGARNPQTLATYKFHSLVINIYIVYYITAL